MMKAIMVSMAIAAIFSASGCAYNSRTNTFGWAPGHYPPKPPAYPIPDLSPGSPAPTGTASVPPPAEQ